MSDLRLQVLMDALYFGGVGLVYFANWGPNYKPDTQTIIVETIACKVTRLKIIVSTKPIDFDPQENF